MKGWGCFLFLLLGFTVVYLLIKFVDLWVILVVAVALFVGIKLFGGKVFEFFLMRVFMSPFKAKGAVLKNAKAEVHSVQTAARPLDRPALEHRRNDGDDEDFDEDDEDDFDEHDEEGGPAAEEPRDYYQVEVTVTPYAPTGAFKLWEPGELQLVKPGIGWDDADDTCEVYETEIWRDGQYYPDEGMKYGGELRVRLLIGVKPGTRKLEFRYYFEPFGEVVLP